MSVTPVSNKCNITGMQVFMFDATKQVELMNQISYSVSPGTATEISLSVKKVSFYRPASKEMIYIVVQYHLHFRFRVQSHVQYNILCSYTQWFSLLPNARL